ncbi:MAG TPA: FAD-dependent oxidoreductase [Polyangiaceae bacterium]
MSRTVAILGGGVGGLSAAHELVERGYRVEVFERQGIPGGKARSIPVVEPLLGPPDLVGGKAFQSPRYQSRRPWPPGEHGFRFFPGFYRHVIDTMERIPFEGGTVADNLVDASEVQIARYDKKPLYVPARFPRSVGDVKTAVEMVVASLGHQFEVTPEETVFFAEKIWKFMTSCEERRLAEYEGVDWWAYIEAETRSPAYQAYFGSAITRSLVAAKARWASTKTIGDIFVQLLVDILDPTVSTTDRLLNGPTNDVWIDPWLAYLKSRGLTYHLDTEVTAIHLDGERVSSVGVRQGGRERSVVADYFVAALPIERMAPLVTAEMQRLEPALSRLIFLADPKQQNLEWMNGIQYYLTEDVPLTHGHTIYMDSEWALTSVSQAQFWRNDLSQYGDGKVRSIISVDISDWDVPGMNGKRADRCTRGEVADETWRQLKRSLNTQGREVLKDEHLHYWYLDPSIVDSRSDVPGIEINEEPLLVNYAGTWKLRPKAVLAIPNLFLASDYVQTYTNLATMEAANEAARAAVNGILDACGDSQARCSIWQLHEPPLLSPFRIYDRLRFERGLHWDASALELSAQARKLLDLLERSPRPDGVPGLDGTSAPDLLRLTSKLTEFLEAALGKEGAGGTTPGSSSSGDKGRIIPL